MRKNSGKGKQRLSALERLETVARELAAGKTPIEASQIAGYPESANFGKNASKRAHRPDVQARIAELRAPGIRKAEEAIGITTEYLLAKLDNLTNFNVDDYLTGRDKSGRRLLDVSRCSRDVLGRLAELGQDVTQTGGKNNRKTLVRTRLKGYSVIDGIRLMAQIKGLMAPEKRDLTIHATDQMTDDELARIAAGGGARAVGAPVDP